MPGSRRAIIVLPAPGGPTSSMLWPPAAAISSARRASDLPAHVGEVRARGRLPARGDGRRRATAATSGGRSARRRPRRASRTGDHRRAARRPPPRARWRRAAGSRRRPRAAPRPRPAARRASAGCRRRATARRAARTSSTSRRSTTPVAARTPSAIGRSNDDARLADVGRRQVDGDAVRRELEPGVADRAAHAVAALAHARVGQADHRERRQAERDVHLDVHGAGVDAEDRRGPQAGEHGTARLQEHGRGSRDGGMSGELRKDGGAFAKRARWQLLQTPVSGEQCRSCQLPSSSYGRFGARSRRSSGARRA